MEFFLRDPDLVAKLTKASSPRKYKKNGSYYLIWQHPQTGSKRSLDITGSMRTLHALYKSCQPTDPYYLFKDFSVMSSPVLTFFKHDNSDLFIVIQPNGIIHCQSVIKHDKVFHADNPETYFELKNYLERD